MQAYYCFRCSQVIPNEELEKGQVVLTKEGKMFCLRCVSKTSTQIPKLLTLCFFLITSLFALEFFQFFFSGFAFTSSVQNKFIESKLEKYLEKEPFEKSFSRYKKSLAERITRLNKKEDELSVELEKKILELEAKLEKKSDSPSSSTNNSEMTHFQERLNQQIKEFSGLYPKIEALQKQVTQLEEKNSKLNKKLSQLKIGMVTNADPEKMAVIDIEDVKNLEAEEKEAEQPLTRNTKEDKSTESWMLRLKDRNKNIRMAAVLELSKLDDSNVIPLLLESTKDQYNFTRQAAIKALGDKKAESAVPILIKALKDPYRGVQIAALKSLHQILKKEWGENYNRLDLQKKIIERYQEWWRKNQ